VILPPMICMMALSYGYASGGDSTIGEVLLFGLKPAILVIVLEAANRVGREGLPTPLMVALAALAFVGTFFFNLPFVPVVVGAAVIGFCAALVVSSAPPGAAHQGVYGAFIEQAAEDIHQDDLPEHTRPTAGRLLRIAAFWLALWFVPVGVLIAAL